MRFLLVALIGFLTLSSVFNFNPGPAPGVKITNALLYLLILGLFFKLAVDRSMRLQLPAIPGLFAILIGYSILTYLTIVLVLDYPRYSVLRNALDLKARHIDQMLFFLVFFYGTRSTKDALFILKCLLAAWVLSHILALLDAVGLVQIGELEQRTDGRVKGLVGESNQYGAFVALSLPAIIAAAIVARGASRLLWGLAAGVTAVALMMTVSRGAFVAITVAAICGAYLFRRYMHPARIAGWAVGIAVALVALLTIAVSLGFDELLYRRVIAESSGDVEHASSGRTAIWALAIEAMLEQPITFLTGFGWNAYSSMPFRNAPHNYYLAQWFNLGLPGLICSVLLLVLPVRIARRALPAASTDLKPVLIGFALATIAFAAASFFVDLYPPWIYFWAYVGLVMRIAVNAMEAVPHGQPAGTGTHASLHSKDPFGWTAAARR